MELKLFTATSTTTSRPPSPAKTTSTSASRLRPTSKETPALVPLPYAEKTLKSLSSTRQSAPQVKWVSCTAATSTPRFLSSPSKRAHLLESLNPLTFKLQGLESSVPLTLLSVDYGPEILRGEDADGLTQGTGAELSANSVVPGNSPDIHRVPQL